MRAYLVLCGVCGGPHHWTAQAALLTSRGSRCVNVGTGAQDVSNALGTSVGSKALTVRQAIIVGAVCEFTGSLVGGEVAATISGGILQMDTFQAMGPAGVDVYAHCMFVTMCGAFTWLAVATYYGLPVSTTHSLVGGLVGVGCVAMSADGVNWGSVGRIGECCCVVGLSVVRTSAPSMACCCTHAQFVPHKRGPDP